MTGSDKRKKKNWGCAKCRNRRSEIRAGEKAERIGTAEAAKKENLQGR